MMTQDHPSKLSFSIEESVWLNKGQEVQEILSMSLEPEITIEEKEDHVYIRGGLRLIGEYRPAPRSEELNLEEGLIKDQVAFRSIEEVSLTNEGTGEIRHIFPIDVTIPVNRIRNLEDVYVQVDSFDYDLPERGCIQLTADILISGMSGTETQADQVASPVPMDREETVEDKSFQYEARKAPEQYEDQAVDEIEEPVQMELASSEESNENSPPLEVPAAQERLYTDEQNFDNYAPKVSFQSNTGAAEAPKKETDSFTSFFVKDKTDSPAQTVEETDTPQEAKMEEPAYDNSIDTEQHQSISPYSEQVQEAREEQNETKINLAPIKNLVNSNQAQAEVERDDDQTEEEVDDRPNYTSHKQENALYLTKMLTNGEERFSKLKMCIIQENESLDTIAERYEISTSQLLRVNRLNQERVEEGQILYIPV